MEFNYEEWKNPAAEYRAKPFWAFNGKLKKEELKRQIKIFKKMGMGGAFLHSRTGLITEYMSKEWLELVDFCVKELHKNGMEAWIYDEDRYSSGSCGGEVTKNLAFREKSMVYDEITGDEFSPPENFIALFAVIFGADGKSVKSYRKINDIKDKKDGERVFCFYYIYMEGDDFFNTSAYVDTMNREATEKFLELTHEKYKEKMGDKFGKQIIGVFTDEPHRGPLLYWFTRKEEKRDILIPYTFCLFDEFKSRKGYDISERLPLLWFGKENEPFLKETYDLIEVLEELFLENFAKPYHDWCRKNNLIFTGHVLHEDNIVAQVTMSGSVMRFLEYFDYPGMDNLGHTNYSFTVPAMAASVAKQLGKKFVLDELYGVTGWQTTFADYKRIGDWQSFGGVTLRCLHHSWYTMKGEAKRDFPASISYQSAWWEDFKYVEDYFSRLQYIFANGEDLTDVAIINPVESAWGLVNQYAHVDFFETDNPVYKKIQQEYLLLYPALWLKGASVDFIDEGLFEKYGKTENGEFICGLKAYKKIILNGNLHLRENTAKALVKFMAEGGKVIIAGDYPEYKEGVKYDFKKDFKNAVKLPFDPDAVLKEIKSDDVITDVDLITVKKRYGEKEIIAFLNAPQNDKTNAVIKIKTDKNCLKLNARTGKKEPVLYERKGDYIVINRVFEKDGELLLVLGEENLPLENKEYEYVDKIDSFDYSLSEPNLLPLDVAECYVDGKFLYKGYILDIDEKVRTLFGLKRRHNEMVQPWYKEKYFDNRDKIYGKVLLKYRFNAQYLPEQILFYSEEAENISLELNGVKIKKRLKKVALDESLRAIPLPRSAFKSGENQLFVSFDFYERTNIETCYLAGDFGVYGDVISTLPKTLKAGDFAEQGLSYYGGRISFKKKFPNGNYLVKAEGADCALIKINGKVIACPPFSYEISVTGEIKGEIVLTRVNTFGTFKRGEKREGAAPQGLGGLTVYAIKKR